MEVCERVKISYSLVSELSHSELLELWPIRKIRITSKCKKFLQDDYDYFTSKAKIFTHIGRGYSKEGQLVYFSLFTVDLKMNGDPNYKLLILGPQYKIPGYKPISPYLGICKPLFLPIILRPGSRLLMGSDVGIMGFQRTYVTLNKFSHTWIHGDENIPSEVNHLLERMKVEFVGGQVKWIEPSGVIRYPSSLKVDKTMVHSLPDNELDRFLKKIPDPFDVGSSDTVLIATEFKLASSIRFVYESIKKAFA